MKKIIYLFFAAILMVLTSCAHHRDGTSVWAEGLWLVPLLLFLGGCAFLWTAWRSHNSGTIIPGKSPTEGPTWDKNLKYPLTKIPMFWLGLACWVGVIIVFIMVNAEK